MWHALAVAVVAAGPSWAADVGLDPALGLSLTGSDAPIEAAHVPRRKTVSLTFDGPGTLTLELYGLRQKRGRRMKPPGKAVVRLGRKKAKKVKLRKKRLEGWAVDGQATWIPTASRRLTFELPAGQQTVKIGATGSARVGVAFVARFEAPAGEVVADTTSADNPDAAQPELPGADEPALPGAEEPALPGAEEPALPGAEEPALPGAQEPALPGVDTDDNEPALPGLLMGAEPELVMAPGATSNDDRAAHRMAVVGPQPGLITLKSPLGEERFLLVELEDGLQLQTRGPGVLVFEIHAHRADAQPESLRPVIIGLMIDDVLVHTVSVDQPANPEYTAPGRPFVPSVRMTVRLPLDVGDHLVRVTLSDAAVLGISLRPQLEGLTDVVEPGVVTREAARRADLRARPPVPEISGTAGIAVMGALWLPSSQSHAGAGALLEGTFGIPIAGRLGVGLAAGATRTEDPRQIEDIRVSGGASRSNLIVTSVPILADLHWSAPLPAPFGLETGIGGGVVLLWNELRAPGVRISEGVGAAALGWLQVTALFEVGPGALFARGAILMGSPLNTGQLRGFDPGGALAAFGYRLQLVGD